MRAAQTGGTETVAAADVTATEPVTVDAGEPLLTAARVMQEHDVHHVVVVSGRDPSPIGMSSRCAPRQLAFVAALSLLPLVTVEAAKALLRRFGAERASAALR